MASAGGSAAENIIQLARAIVTLYDNKSGVSILRLHESSFEAGKRDPASRNKVSKNSFLFCGGAPGRSGGANDPGNP